MNTSPDAEATLETISVCVCTYKRAHLLGHLLGTLLAQETGGRFRHDIFIVDNDAEGSAKATVDRFRALAAFPIHYEIEPEPNIALARNRVLRAADGDFMACLDDDEYAASDWLLALWKAAKESKADGVLGPVAPDYEVPPPRWVVAGALLVRRSYPTGTVLTDPRQTRTGNFMISRRLLEENERLFDPDFGRLGGEDIDFFRRMLGRGYKFIWCDEAQVCERVPASRLTRTYFIKRGLVTGINNARRAPLFSGDSLKSLSAVLAYITIMPFLAIFRLRLVIPYMTKLSHHFAKLCARAGLRIIKHRPT